MSEEVFRVYTIHYKYFNADCWVIINLSHKVMMMIWTLQL